MLTAGLLTVLGSTVNEFTGADFGHIDCVSISEAEIYFLLTVWLGLPLAMHIVRNKHLRHIHKQIHL